MTREFKESQYIIYQNGDSYEIGKIKSLTDDGAFIWYHSGSTAAKTPYDCIYPIINEDMVVEDGFNKY